MYLLRRKLLPSLVYLLVAFSPAGQALQLLPEDPLFSEPCSNCHVAVDANGDVPSVGAEVLYETQEVLCIRCHAGAMQGAHPSGVIPSFTTPPEYPLDFKGEMTCSTCHVMHLLGHATKRVPAAGFDDCLMCHQL